MIPLKLTAAAAALSLCADASHATTGLFFLIDGNTYVDPFAVTNTSDAGESITRLFIDLAGAGPEFCFDVVDGGVCNGSLGVAFGAIGGAIVDNADVVDGGTTLDILFDSFAAGATFEFDVDVDQVTSPTVLGNDLIGATAFADFSNGKRLFGTFEAVEGNDDASAFSAEGEIEIPPVPLPAGLPLLAAGIGALALVRRKA